MLRASRIGDKKTIKPRIIGDRNIRDIKRIITSTQEVKLLKATTNNQSFLKKKSNKTKQRIHLQNRYRSYHKQNQRNRQRYKKRCAYRQNKRQSSNKK